MWRLFLFLLLPTTLLASPLNLMLLRQYTNQNIEGWVMSEKLDGVRGYWDGKQLLSRQNYPLNPPEFFTKGFPPFPIDGEIFSERGKFAEISSIVRSNHSTGWKKLKLHVFDVPNAKGDLFARLAVLQHYLNDNSSDYIEIIPQIPIENKHHLQQFFEHIQEMKGEGVVLRSPNANYVHGRSSQILKLKAVFDEECTVIAHHKGKGKYADKLGSLTCKNARGTFRIGSGFKDKDRDSPPPVGSTITYKYRGFTKTGKPKFATFWRIRKE
ncbi:DNA ligase [Otariodibacter oris]|uniref:DNA ligase-1 n=1 Tax=Otariodibacter oris TaxID=1032623 RepID=A0A420XEV6_9PAST|nr:DNA ligase [Otariodibacter oris]QGM80211.1 DNA ligase [Otariodibacter oris]RKR70599.1 DNA ligase-1 [Otariodibacter oris]